MKIKKSIAAIAASALVAGIGAVALAGPAAAIPQGPLQPGSIYWFSTAGSLDTQVPANLVTSGSGTMRPWATITMSAACPAGTGSVAPYLRIPQAGVPEDDWTQVAIGAAATLKDSQGRFYITGNAGADRLGKSEVVAYNAANGGSGDFPLIETCLDATGNALGYFRTMVHIAGVDNTTYSDISWNLINPAIWGGNLTSSTTVLSSSASSVELGSPVTLTAAVTPSGATGTVEFFTGATSLGSSPSPPALRRSRPPPCRSARPRSRLSTP